MNPTEEPNGAGAPGSGVTSLPATALDSLRRRIGGGGNTPPSPPVDEEDEEDDGMLRMSFMGHLEELRSRIFKALMGVAIVFIASLSFSGRLWDFVCQPAVAALTALHFEP